MELDKSCKVCKIGLALDTKPMFIEYFGLSQIYRLRCSVTSYTISIALTWN